MTPSHNGLSPLRSLSAARCDETMQRVPDSVVLQCSTLKRSAANSLRRLQGRYQLYRKGRWVDLAYVAAQEGHVNCLKLLAQHGAGLEKLVDDIGNAPIHIAWMTGRVDCTTEVECRRGQAKGMSSLHGSKVLLQSMPDCVLESAQAAAPK